MLYDCVLREAEQIVTAVKEVVEKTPPELVGDIFTNGMFMTGGGALLHGMDRLLAQRTKIQTHVAENAVECVAIGTGESFGWLDKLVDGFITPSMRKF